MEFHSALYKVFSHTDVYLDIIYVKTKNKRYFNIKIEVFRH